MGVHPLFSNQHSDPPKIIWLLMKSMMTERLNHTGVGLPVTSTITGHATIYSTPVLWQAILGAFLRGNLV